VLKIDFVNIVGLAIVEICNVCKTLFSLRYIFVILQPLSEEAILNIKNAGKPLSNLAQLQTPLENFYRSPLLY